jgi:hypothetical protein
MLLLVSWKGIDLEAGGWPMSDPIFTNIWTIAVSDALREKLRGAFGAQPHIDDRQV